MIFAAKMLTFVVSSLFLYGVTELLFGVPDEFEWLAFMVSITYASVITHGVSDD